MLTLALPSTEFILSCSSPVSSIFPPSTLLLFFRKNTSLCLPRPVVLLALFGPWVSSGQAVTVSWLANCILCIFYSDWILKWKYFKTKMINYLCCLCCRIKGQMQNKPCFVFVWRWLFYTYWWSKGAELRSGLKYLVPTSRDCSFHRWPGGFRHIELLGCWFFFSGSWDVNTLINEPYRID